jgi:hypothetical protein
MWPRRFTRPLFRIALRGAARRYVTHHWRVIPGAPTRGDRCDCGVPGCLTTACHPAVTDWQAVASDDPAQVAAWWDRVDHGVLLATGHSFDVLELAGPVGRQVAREVRGPVAVAPPQRWMFLVRPGAGLRSELAKHSRVVLHRAGSWIPAPPTRLPAGLVRWEHQPARSGWRLPDAAEVQRVALRALDRHERSRRR